MAEVIILSIGNTLISNELQELGENFTEIAQNTYQEIQTPLGSESFLIFESRYDDYTLQSQIDMGYYNEGEYPVVCGIDPSAMLSEFQLEFWNEFVAAFNDADIVAESSYLTGYVPEIDVQEYEAIKSRLLSKFLAMVYNQMAKDTSGLDEAAGLPTYEFGFVGPLPGMVAPGVTGLVSLEKDGFLYTVPMNSSFFVGINRLLTKELAQRSVSGLKNVQVSGNDNIGWLATATVECYGYSHYCLYDGVLYFAKKANYTSTAYERSVNNQIVANVALYVSADGEKLENTDFNVDTSTYSVGFVYNVTGNVENPYPYVNTISEDDFTTLISGGETVEFPRTDDEELIGDALALGLLTDDSTLTLDENGNIVEGDGITLAKLQELIDLISEGNLQFEDMQEYLDLLTKLVGAGNLTETQQKILLENIEELTDSQAKDISEIKTAVLEMSEALTGEAELEDTDVNFEYITVEHTGLTEAEQIVNTSLPIVGQSKQLLTNLVNQAEAAPDYVPNFSFWWDSDKDGESEKYTVLDLSFMEQTLTNANLDDKNRFKTPMTVKEFIQSLAVLIFYVTFALKLLKKIPGLIGGVESSSGDIKTVNNS